MYGTSTLGGEAIAVKSPANNLNGYPGSAGHRDMAVPDEPVGKVKKVGWDPADTTKNHTVNKLPLCGAEMP